MTLSADRYRCTGRRFFSRHRWEVINASLVVVSVGRGVEATCRCRACGVTEHGVLFASTAELLASGYGLTSAVRGAIELWTPAPKPSRLRRLLPFVPLAGFVLLFVISGGWVIDLLVSAVSASLEARCQATQASGFVQRVTYLRGDTNNDFRIVFDDGRHADVDLGAGDEIPTPGTYVRVCKRDHCHVEPVSAAPAPAPAAGTGAEK
jgi:hypothetical protein